MAAAAGLELATSCAASGPAYFEESRHAHCARTVHELNASAIHYYEQRGLLSAPHRSNGQRRYPTDALDRVLLIRFARDMGFTLDEIKLLGASYFSGGRRNAKASDSWICLE
jgi:hypothetical protein